MKDIKKKPQKRKKSAQMKELPAEISDKPELHRYWKQRFELFSRFNAGIQLDTESWFSVTPEVIARHIAERCQVENGQGEGVILDAFCGCGGNTIQFAKYCSKVIAIDVDPLKLEYCKNNAAIYGVQDKIEFICGDFTKLSGSLKADVVFLSPPWGGPGYDKLAEVFDVQTMIPMDGLKLFEMAKEISPNVAYYLPRNVDLDQVTKLAGEGNYVDIERNLFRGRVKAITAYYGQLVKLP